MKKFLSLTLIVAAAGFAIYAAVLDKLTAPQVTFVSLKGERLTTDSLRGKVVLVNFWATDCPVCVKEMPDMVKTYNKYRARGFEYIAVAMQYDPPNYVIRYAGKNALPFTVALDPRGELAKAFGDVRLTPTTFIIDKRGKIVKRIVGAPDFPKLHQLLEEKLAEAA
jgi:peroxiredoxin